MKSGAYDHITKPVHHSELNELVPRAVDHRRPAREGEGRVEAADGGTVFLDGIGEVPIELQVRVLRLIQEHEIETIGTSAPTKVDVRLIATTHRGLTAMVEDGSLRERPSDILELAQYFLERGKQKYQRPELKLPPHLLPAFGAYRWPGNVRQLENVIERLIVLCGGTKLQ